ncbi:hypothetical protein B9Z19DRAFT_1086309 [Tuber borchii]|uniref:Uncharacterized protein n=1 Tax=Tuber borchii TaxID=42251 RepID=A0A2T6ZPR4_TUBBO|nr:hypothetical protein B9Z19DRAFT_1086309 [Tuber borchii]
MASIEFEEPADACDYRTFYRRDGSTFRARVYDCGSTTCRYSASYIPPQGQQQ